MLLIKVWDEGRVFEFLQTLKYLLMRKLNHATPVKALVKTGRNPSLPYQTPLDMKFQ